MLDVYDWIRSPEIRDYLRTNCPLSVGEKTRMICGAFRSIEEKEAALRELWNEAEPGEARETIKRLIRLYGLVLEELRKTGPEHLFVLPSICPWRYKRSFLAACETTPYSSYAELLEHADDFHAGPHVCAIKWERVNEKWESAIEFDVQRVQGVSCTTRFWLSDEKMKEWGIDEDRLELQIGNRKLDFERLHNPIPFQTGDLVKLDAPMFVKPLFGVMDNVVDLNGTRYMWFGYVDGGRLNTLDLSYSLLHVSGGYRVIDWLHSAGPEELPEGEEILREISEYLSSRPHRDSDVYNEFLDIFGVRNNRPFRRWTVTPFPELLAQAREERKAHG